MAEWVAGGMAGRAARRRSPQQPVCRVDFRSLLGEADWGRLPVAVQRRFCVAAHAAPVLYEGGMAMRASWVGRFIAQLCRLIGTPLAPWRGEDVPVTVDVWTDQWGALVWDRTYRFPERRPILVSSRKLVDRSGGLMEVVRGGLGMTLKLSVENGALCFRSTGYFIQAAGVRIGLPGLLTPGRAEVRHEDGTSGAFRFTLRFVHAWFGETIFQQGWFRDPPAPNEETRS